MSESNLDIDEIKAQIEAISQSEKKDLFNWTLNYLSGFKDLVITKEIKDIPVKSEESLSSSVRRVVSYVFSYKSNSIFIFRFGYVIGWELPYYDSLMKTFKGITKILNNRVLSEYSSEYAMCNYNNMFWYLKDLIRASLVNLDYQGIKV